MNNFEHFIIAYRHIKAISIPDDRNLKAHIRIMKTAADVIFEKLLVSGCIESVFVKHKCDD